MLPWTGSQTHSAALPSAFTLFKTEGRCSLSLSADMRVINVTLPGTFLGLNVSRISMTSSGEALSLILTPTGFWMPLTNSKCARPGCLVRSPTHNKCALQSYHLPVVESSRVIACS